MAKWLSQVPRVLYHMLRKSISKQNLLMDLHLLLKCSKNAGKAIGHLLTSRHYHHHLAATAANYQSALSCRSMDPNTAVFVPREVEFSCSNTPSYPSIYATRRKHRQHRKRRGCPKYDAATVAKMFEILNSNILDDCSMVESPSPALGWVFGKSPVGAVRQLRVTDSPFSIREEDEEEGGHVDREAEEFIRRFYEQLSLQD